MQNNKLRIVKSNCKNLQAERIIGQLEYGLQLSKVHGGKFDAILDHAINLIFDRYSLNNAILLQDVLDAERELEVLRPVAKKLTALCVSHAHIDLNWRWSFDETVAIILSTFRTMLDLMREYPDFTFAQSQAAIYQIVEQYDPELLGEIKQRVKQGRWEVLASTWVEADKNIPNGEENVREILYARNYMMQLFDLTEDYFNIDFASDAFGHHANIPEISRRAGIKYYYLTRGKKGPALYKWKSASGSEIIAYREISSYSSRIEPTHLSYLPEVASRYGLNQFIKLYGVGNHGGGATRKDIEYLMSFNEWPVMPTIKFSTLHEFYESVENQCSQLEESFGENNTFFPGCYSSQTRIKQANFVEKNLFYQTEKICALNCMNGLQPYPVKQFETAWQTHLFSHFHDIITGTCTMESRHFAVGNSQKTKALLGVEKTKALKELAKNIDLKKFMLSEEKDKSRSYGAGSGFYYASGIYVANTGNYVYLLYNSSNVTSNRVVKIPLWDYAENLDNLCVKDTDGKVLEFQLLSRQPIAYWSHEYNEILVCCDVPANGYNVIILTKDNNQDMVPQIPWMSAEWIADTKPAHYVLENENVRAEFENNTMSLISLVDKQSQTEMLAGDRKGYFNFVEEDGFETDSAWLVGGYMKKEPLTNCVRILNRSTKKGLIDSFSYELNFKSTVMQVEVSLKKGDNCVRYHVSGDFNEKGIYNRYTPNLEFTLDVEKDAKLVYDIPFGLIERPQMDMDQCCNSFVYENIGNKGIIIAANGKNSVRFIHDKVNLTLIRGTTDPDTFPENYHHNFSFGLIPYVYTNAKTMIEMVECFSQEILTMPIVPSNGFLPPRMSMYELEGNCVLSAVKMTEIDARICFRFYNPSAQAQYQLVKMPFEIHEAFVADLCENICNQLEVKGKEVRIEVEAFSIFTLLLA